MQDLNLVEEFLDGWTTYALAELDREDDDEEDGVERLERLTHILAKGNRAALQKAQELLERWLRKTKNQTHGLCGRFRLRRALILKKLKDHDGALVELRKLLAADPESAALNCLVGVLYGWLNGKENWKTAVQYFDKAIEYAPNWSEPKLEKFDKYFFLGRDDNHCWQQIVDNARNWLDHGNISITDRERLILWTYRAVASALLDPMCVNSESYAKMRLEAQKIQIDPLQREDWFLQEIYSLVVKPQLDRDDHATQEARREIKALMDETHKKLMHTDKGLDE